MSLHKQQLIAPNSLPIVSIKLASGNVSEFEYSYDRSTKVSMYILPDGTVGKVDGPSVLIDSEGNEWEPGDVEFHTLVYGRQSMVTTRVPNKAFKPTFMKSHERGLTQALGSIGLLSDLFVFNLLVSGSGWSDSRDTMPEGRTFEYTDQHLQERFSKNGKLDLKKLAELPTVFMEEGAGEQFARVGTITAAQISGQEIRLEYAFDASIPPIANKQLKKMSSELDIKDFEFSRTHWAVKDVDLFRVLLSNVQPSRHKPKVFRIAEPELIEPTLVSVMMPFDASFKLVHSRIKKLVESFGLRRRRADDIWENPAVIQDVVSLIDRSQLVICDCSQRNPNVFYEIGIAHTLGRDVILITQSRSDIPFDLRHLRYVEYLNNKEGRKNLAEKLREKLSDLAP